MHRHYSQGTIRVHKRRRPRHRRTRDRGYALREMEFLSDPYFLRMFRMDRANFDRLAEQVKQVSAGTGQEGRAADDDCYRRSTRFDAR
mmetsp:Transcript_706/g.1518  ORF Transcript_706/g.1518 Transcript_706/m.1518 type:complete len:88 (-) Transcript_706:789-1052(-)